MRCIIMALALSILGFVGLTAGSEPASADYITYPWCAQYRGGDRGGGRNCGFWTFNQCMAAVSGYGGQCEQNFMYRGPQPGMIPPPPAVSRGRGYSGGGAY